MSDDKGPRRPITVLIDLPLALDAEAYGTRINREPGWRAQSLTEAEAWDVRLSDQCRVRSSGKEGPSDQGPTVVVASPCNVASNQPSCTCCWAVPRGAAWPSLFRAMIEAAGREPGRPETEGLSQLTRREIEVLRLVGLGMSVNDCAEHMGVSPSTVGNHKYRLMRKLKVNTSLQLLRIAVQSGLSSFD